LKLANRRLDPKGLPIFVRGHVPPLMKKGGGARSPVARPHESPSGLNDNEPAALITYELINTFPEADGAFVDCERCCDAQLPTGLIIGKHNITFHENAPGPSR
jgi:hypothetical protein